jgi:hypothetical protein
MFENVFLLGVGCVGPVMSVRVPVASRRESERTIAPSSAFTTDSGRWSIILGGV